MLAGASPRAVFLLLLSALLFWPLAVWRPLRIVSVLFLVILGAANIVHDGFFGYLIDEFFIASSLRTTSSETREFLTSLPMGTMVWCAVWLLLCAGIVRFMLRKGNEPNLQGRASQRLAIAALLVWAGFLGYSHWTGPLDTTTALRKLHIVYPLHIANAGWRQYQITDALLYTPLLPEPTPPSPQSQVDTVVVVLGESASAHRWSLLGYQQAPTNASLQDIPGLQVARVLANGLNTAAALPYVLTGLSALDSVTHQAPSFIDLAQHAGYKTIVLNNSRYLRTGEDFLTHALRRSANVYLKVGDGDYDEVLTPALQTALQDPAPRKLIVLHTYGSHVTAASRYPKTAHQLADSYDTSIRYTSDLLAQWIRMLDASSPQQSALLLYASDHGVVVPPCSGSSRSGGSLSSYEIPALAWANPVSLAQNAQLLTPLRQQDPAQVHISNTVIPEMAIQALGYSLQALSPTHRPRQVLLDAEGHPWEHSKAQLCQGQGT
ncbi:sulfatase-like hydrolase/transferase [Comamonas terrigena]|jgi:glucan phosphoethanolaminetransferase (alkaline phosphatase superfamily)|uniref:sulfatase-like hydrolase/transferase n=1 Tax=Comamonas terrigena TaxID=32013 RepID=UPI002356F906|nr:sulfatase-like hydrolase/transferase [Comamonas terrigena]MDH1292924.1 sulfatase-like hydrolase/transferase [Comamonas terrigena]